MMGTSSLVTPTTLLLYIMCPLLTPQNRLIIDYSYFEDCGKNDVIVGQLIANLEDLKHPVDGRNPAPVDMANIPLFTGF